MPVFHVTPRAAQEIAAIAARQGRPGAALRVSVSAGGCSGLQYGFDLADAPEADDLVVEQDGVRVLVDAVSLEFLDGATLDWHESLMGSHFKVDNPQAVSGCGCGASFAV
ncbi:MAG: iron-sulfur cluster assembly accessory protein [Rhodovarius sp.]|nr:iron-sulfur cluster assembly accessory protein [Rhodovarius sp.]MCX7933208.1 iron-sulfur cluster assembly accessory protein [Rhodovarius sp.]MDW8315036.1 iron-sulfur cluster assembly accessory protein [Rhodovarius sp.]